MDRKSKLGKKLLFYEWVEDTLCVQCNNIMIFFFFIIDNMDKLENGFVSFHKIFLTFYTAAYVLLEYEPLYANFHCKHIQSTLDSWKSEGLMKNFVVGVHRVLKL